jgi:quinoprotein glucose dehydrogenase
VGASGSRLRGEWLAWGGDAQNTRYSPLDQIRKENLHDLRVAWRWASLDQALQKVNPVWRTGRNTEVPLVANGVLYTVTGLGIVVALDPATGRTLWSYDAESYKAGKPTMQGFISRGLSYWTDGTAERLFVGRGDAYVMSIDPKKGKPDPAFGSGGVVDITLGIRVAQRPASVPSMFSARRPLVAGDVVIVGNGILDPVRNKEMPPGYVHAFDVRTGKRRWTFHTVPKPGEVGYETWLDGSAEYSGNTNVWAGMAYDPVLDYVYLPTSTPTSDYYGGHRPGSNLFAESLVCLEAKTGRRVWHFQAVHHGLWDYDFPAPPVLGEISISGRPIKAIMQVSKQAFTYVFDRRTGEPVWPIEERRVPAGNVPGEWYAPTQPFPTKPPPFDLQGATEENLIDFTPELRARALEQLKHFEHGPLYTPPSLKGTLTLPGLWRGANWGGAAFDPETAALYVPSQIRPTVIRLVESDPRQTNLRFRMGGGLGDPKLMTLDGLPLFKPPYARVTAIGMNKGEHLWTAALGNGPRNHPLLKDLAVTPLGGSYGRGTVLVTKSLLFVGVSRVASTGGLDPPAWAQWADPDENRKVIYVFDKRSGALLREMELDTVSVSAPITYLHRGKQYIVMAAGAGLTDELVALSLP